MLDHACKDVEDSLLNINSGVAAHALLAGRLCMVHRGQRHYVIYRDVQALSVEVPSMPCSALAEASHLQQRSLSAQSSLAEIALQRKS